MVVVVVAAVVHVLDVVVVVAVAIHPGIVHLVL